MSTDDKGNDNPAPIADPFDPLSCRVSADLDYGSERVLSTVPVRKPRKDEFFRVHPDPEFRDDFLIVEREDSMDREIYLVTPQCADLVTETAKVVRVFTVINRRGVVLLWPAKLPVETNAGRAYAESGLKIAEDAMRVWVRMWGDRDLGAYAHVRARGNISEPKWPDKTFADLLRIAFADRVIDRADHPYIRELGGEI